MDAQLIESVARSRNTYVNFGREIPVERVVPVEGDSHLAVVRFFGIIRFIISCNKWFSDDKCRCVVIIDLNSIISAPNRVATRHTCQRRPPKTLFEAAVSLGLSEENVLRHKTARYHH